MTGAHSYANVWAVGHRGAGMDLFWSISNWIDAWTGPYGTVAILGGMLAGFLLWMLSASR